MSYWRTLAGRLFKLVFGWYLVLAIAVTSVQLMIEYSSIRDDVSANLRSLGQSFSPSIADALWAFDRPQLEALATGIARATYVTGVRIEADGGEAIAAAGTIPTADRHPREGLFAPYQREQFPLEISTPRKERRTMGHLVLFSDRSVAIERVKYSFFVIVINSLIKTTGLWLIFYLVITRSLAKPLAALTGLVSRIEFAADGGGPVPVDYPHEDELGRLLHATHKMQKRVASSQQLVAERTRELVEALAAAESANRLKSAFLSNVSHELRTPLNLILGYVQIMEMSGQVPAEELGYVREIERSGHQLLALINDVIEISRIEAGATPPAVSSFDLPDLLATVHREAASRANDEGIEVALRLSSDLPKFVVADAGMLRQMLLNLLAAAVKRGGSGRIDFSASAEPANGQARLTFSVQDAGAPIARDQLEGIFQPFSQARFGDYAAGGTGLELTLVGEYARLLGGTATAENAAAGGAIFRLTVPVDISIQEAA